MPEKNISPVLYIYIYTHVLFVFVVILCVNPCVIYMCVLLNKQINKHRHTYIYIYIYISSEDTMAQPIVRVGMNT